MSLEILKALLIWKDGGEPDTDRWKGRFAADEREKRRGSNLSAFNHTSHTAPERVTEADRNCSDKHKIKDITICSSELLLLQCVFRLPMRHSVIVHNQNANICKF